MVCKTLKILPPSYKEVKPTQLNLLKLNIIHFKIFLIHVNLVTYELVKYIKIQIFICQITCY